MSTTDSHIITARLLDLQRTVERLSHHVNDLQSQLVKAHGMSRTPKLWRSSIWQRLAGRNLQSMDSMDRPVRENRRKVSHAVHSI
jgi:hypothetical protein